LPSAHHGAVEVIDFASAAAAVQVNVERGHLAAAPAADSFGK